MYYQLTSEIQSNEIVNIIKCDKNCNSEIEQWDLPLDFKRALQWYWFESEITVGPSLYSVSQIVEKEKQMNNLKNKLLQMGEGPNGDELFINSETLEVLFWNHEEATTDNFRIIADCSKLYNHIFLLLLNVRNRNFIPWDSFATKDYFKIYNGI